MSTEWNQSDTLRLSLEWVENPLARGDRDAVEQWLRSFERLDEELRPTRMSTEGGRAYRYSQERVQQMLEAASESKRVEFWLSRRPMQPEIEYNLSLGGLVNNLTAFRMPLSSFREQERAARMMEWMRMLASSASVHSGLVHSGTDWSMVHVKELRPSASVVHQPHEAEVYWLNVYGPQKVEKLGRRRVLSVPCWHLEELPGGAVLWLTRPTPMDFDTEQAREAQARALVHLRPELSLEETLAALRERSRAFQPLEPHFHPEVAPLLRLHVEREGLATRRRTVERFNAFHPPEVREWLPLGKAPPSDVADASLSSPEFWKQAHRSLFLLLGKQIPSLQVATPSTLPQVDLHARLRHWSYAEDKDKASYASALGLYLALLMVHHLHGRWVPRRNLEESYVVLGSRAWLPLVRARHLLESEESALTASLTQFYLHAARFASEPPHMK